jgi:putative oxidoreductase
VSDSRGRGKGRLLLWAATGLLAAMFLMAGGTKLMGADMHVESFARWGYPDWFRLAVGATEVVAAALLVMPRTAVLGATLIIAIMAGATFTHLALADGEAANAVVTVVLLSVAAAIGWARWPA